jgi:starch-binding outer membrane protein, SusD/RagB family
MTNRFLRGTAGIVATAVVGLTTAACGDFLDVRNPTIVDAATIDPVADLPTFSLSARQNFSRAYGWTSIYGAWFTGEAYVGDTFPTRNEFGLRNIDYTNGSLAGDVWNPLSLAIATNERVVELATEAGVTDQLPYKRSALFAGYSVLLMAEHFCEGAVGSGLEPGVRMSTTEMLNHAITRFEQARDAGATGDEAALHRNAARVGIARAQLQLGNYGAAITAASSADAGRLRVHDAVSRRPELPHATRQRAVVLYAAARVAGGAAGVPEHGRSSHSVERRGHVWRRTASCSSTVRTSSRAGSRPCGWRRVSRLAT